MRPGRLAWTNSDKTVSGGSFEPPIPLVIAIATPAALGCYAATQTFFRRNARPLIKDQANRTIVSNPTVRAAPPSIEGTVNA